jgi:hypothetical protein
MMFKVSPICAVVVVAAIWQGSSCGSSTSKNTASANGNVNMATANMNANMTNSGQPSQKERTLATGTWGGDHLNLESTADGATLEFDCGHGTIAGRLVVDENGRFSMKGRYVREHGGPTRQGEDQSGEPATYSGTSDGKTMTLTVTIDGTNEVIGTFTLTHGKMGRVRKCL